MLRLMATAPKNTAKKKEEPKSRGVFEKIPGSGIWWVPYAPACPGPSHPEKQDLMSPEMSVRRKEPVGLDHQSSNRDGSQQNTHVQ
jgi:hypothetical protein